MYLPIKNDSDHEIQIGLEPEGDSIQLSPGDKLVIRFLVEEGDAEVGDLDIEYRVRFISVASMTSKEVFLNGVQIRR